MLGIFFSLKGSLGALSAILIILIVLLNSMLFKFKIYLDQIKEKLINFLSYYCLNQLKIAMKNRLCYR